MGGVDPMMSGAACATRGYGGDTDDVDVATFAGTGLDPGKEGVPAESTGAGGAEFYDPTTGTGGTGLDPKTTEPQISMDLATASARIAGMDDKLLSAPGTAFVPSDLALSTYASMYPSSVPGIQGAGGAVAVATHVVPNTILRTADIPEGQSTFTTVAGKPLTITKVGNLLQVSSGVSMANVVQSDVSAGNAIIHIIDNVLAPVA